MTHTLSLCVCSNIRWRLRALTEFPYDLRRISHSLCNNKQSLKLPSLRWNFQTKQTGRFGRRGLYLLFTKALRPPSPSPPPLQVSGNASTYMYNLHIRLKHVWQRHLPYMETPYSSPSSCSPSIRLPLFTAHRRIEGFGVGLPVKSAVRSIDRATPKIVECRLAPRPNPAGKVDYANACRKRRTMQRERIGRMGEGQVVTGAEIERKNKRTKGKGKKEIVSDGGFRARLRS